MSNVFKLDDFSHAETLDEKISKCATSDQLVKLFFDSTDIQWEYCKFRRNSKTITSSIVQSEFDLWFQKNNVCPKLHKNKFIKAGFIKYDEEQYYELINILKSKLAYSTNNEWQKLKMLADFHDDDILIYQSWIWNVKQVIFGKDKTQVPIPVLFSKSQGQLKSTFNKKLYSPMKQLAQLHDFKIIKDTFSSELWSKLLVVDFDEMSGLKKSLVDTFKSWIYKDDVSNRSINTSQLNTYSKVTSAIGSSNLGVSEYLSDTTGSRRIWQVSLNKSLIDACNEVDFLKLWLSVDESKECPLYVDEAFKRIESRQFNEQRKKTDSELFVEYYKKTETTFRIKASELYKLYVSYCKKNCLKRLGEHMFFKSMKEYKVPRQASGSYYEIE
jgi:hypothetical protein